MERIDRERWNKLSDGAKTLTRVLAKYADTGHASVNDLRLDQHLKFYSSRQLMLLLQELQSRDFGHLEHEDEADPMFIINVPYFQSLAQSHRITHQAPHGA